MGSSGLSGKLGGGCEFAEAWRAMILVRELWRICVGDGLSRFIRNTRYEVGLRAMVGVLIF